MKEALLATDREMDGLSPWEPMCATETAEAMPGDPAHVYGVKPDDAFSDRPLNEASTEVVGRMSHDLQGLAQEDHNSGNLTFVGPVDHPAPPGQSTGGAFGGGYGKVT